MTPHINGHHHHRSALILYGSETGNSEDAAELLGRAAERLRFQTRVAAMDTVEINELLHYTIVIFTISTTGQGDIPINARRFWKSLLRRRLPPNCLGHVNFTTFGFGDSSYVKFNWAARKLHKRLEQLGGRQFYPRGEADEQHEEGTDGAFLPWSQDLKSYLLENCPLPEGVLPIPDDEFLQPKVILQIAKSEIDAAGPREDQNLASASQHQTSSTMDMPVTDACLKEAYDPSDLSTDEAPPPPDLFDIPNHEIVVLKQNDRITSPTHFQDVRHIVLQAHSELSYHPGDILTIYPKNFPSDVSALLTLQNWTSIADTPLTSIDNPAHPAPPTYIPSLSDIPLPLHRAPTLRTLLLHSLDITAIPRRYFFEICSKFCLDPTHRERLLEFSNPAYTDEFFDYATRPRRSILEILQDFPTVQIPWEYALSIFPRLRGRQFSISSGGILKHPDGNTDKTAFHLTVALVQYRTVLKKIRRGVCSRYLSVLKPGTRLAVTLARGSLGVHKHGGEMLRRPLLLIAPGTGVAPMRSLLWERDDMLPVSTAGSPRAKAVLLFGGRKREGDFLYGDEWGGVDAQVLTAWSREQREKVYVQDVIRREARLVWELLRPARRGESGERVERGERIERGEVGGGGGVADGDGTVFVCGSSGKMPVAVRRALVDVFRIEGAMTEEEAEEVLRGMEVRGRYLQETW